MKTNIIIFLIATLLISILTGCANTTSQTISEEVCDDSKSCSFDLINNTHEVNIDKLEIYHFHATSQCVSCITVGDYAKATVNTYFEEELEKGIIVFDHINGELPENNDLVVKYGATGSSLWLGTYKGDDFKAEENTNVWYKIRNKQDYMNYLKGIIKQKLAGN